MRILFAVFFDPYDLGSRQLAAYMRDKGHEVAIVGLKTSHFNSHALSRPSREDLSLVSRVLHGNALTIHNYTVSEPISENEWELFSQTIAAWKPDLMGYGTRSINHQFLPRAIPAMRKAAPQAFLVAGGTGPTLDPDFSLGLGVDAVIRGEGEYALEALAQALANGFDWREGPNLVYMADGERKSTPMLPLEKNLDAFPLPLPDSEELIFIDGDRVKRSDTLSRTDTFTFGGRVILLASRGCPADCSYCGGRAIRNVYRAESRRVPRIRRHSPERVMVMAVRAKNEGRALIIFGDEFFLYPAEQLRDFFIKYRAEVGLPFTAHLAPDQLVAHPELLDAAFRANWLEFGFGLQSGSQSFCREVYTRNNNNEHILAAIRACLGLGMQGFCHMIAGNPLEQEKDRQQTHDLLARFPAFDPSFRTRVGFSTNKLGIPHGDTPLKARFPQLASTLCSREFFYREAMLLELRLVLDNNEFNTLRDDPRYVEAPHLLGAVYHDLLRKKHETYLAPLLPALKGQDCFFWGCGAAYRQHKALFAHAKPRAILYDLPGEAPASVDGIPVWHPDKALAEAPDIPIVVFAHRLHCNAIHRKLLQRHQRADNVIFCAAIN